MLPAVHPPPTRRQPLHRLMLAVWLAMLLVLSGHTKADEPSAVSALEAATIFCHAGHEPNHGQPVLPHHVHEATLLQASLAGVHHFAIPTLAPCLPPQSVLQITRPGVQQARAPPGIRRVSAYSRGPPIPV